MLRVNATNRQELLKRITFHSKSLVFKTVSVPATTYCLSISVESSFRKKREHFHQRNALLRTPHPLREHYRKLLMPTPVRSELRSLRHSRNSYVVFQEDAKNFGLFIQKRSNSERKDSNFSFIQSILERKSDYFHHILCDFCIFGHRI